MVVDEFRNEFVAELSFRLRTAEASPAGNERDRSRPPAEGNGDPAQASRIRADKAVNSLWG
jgi:hypothetical protein